MVQITVHVKIASDNQQIILSSDCNKRFFFQLSQNHIQHYHQQHVQTNNINTKRNYTARFKCNYPDINRPLRERAWVGP